MEYWLRWRFWPGPGKKACAQLHGDVFPKMMKGACSSWRTAHRDMVESGRRSLSWLVSLEAGRRSQKWHSVPCSIGAQGEREMEGGWQGDGKGDMGRPVLSLNGGDKGGVPRENSSFAQLRHGIIL